MLLYGRVSAQGAIGRRIDPLCWSHRAISHSSAVVCAIQSMVWWLNSSSSSSSSSSSFILLLFLTNRSNPIGYIHLHIFK